MTETVAKTVAQVIVEAIIENLNGSRKVWMRFDTIKANAEMSGISKQEVDEVLIGLMKERKIAFKMGNPGNYDDKSDLMDHGDQIYTHCVLA